MAGDLEDRFAELAGGGSLSSFGDLIGPLLDHDRERKSDLVRTLRVYFRCNANASEAAQRLYLHRNSMNYRLERVQVVTGLDLGDPASRLALQLGLLHIEGEERG